MARIRPARRAPALCLVALCLALPFLAGGGCAAGKPDTPPAQGTAERPRIVAAEVRLGETSESGGFSRGTKPLRPGEETVVGEDRFVLSITLDPVPAESWYARNVRISGPGAAEPRKDLYSSGMVEVAFPRGKSGDVLVVSLGSVLCEGAAAPGAEFRLRRSPEPAGLMQVYQPGRVGEAGGRWREVAPSEVLTSRPLRLRLVFTKQMDPATVQAAVDAALPAPAVLRWPDAMTAEVDLANPPPALRIFTTEMRDREGLWVRGGLPAVFTGEPPRLWALEMAHGADARRPLAEVPANVTSAIISPDGRQLLLSYIAESTGGLDRAEEAGPVVVDPASGVRTFPARQGTPLGWARDGFLLAADSKWAVADLEGKVLREGGLQGVHVATRSLSPDGTKLAALAFRFEDTHPDTYLAPTDLAVVDLTDGTVRWIKDFTRTYLPPTEWVMRAAPAWSPDGRYLAGLSDLVSGGVLRVADLEDGSVRDAAEVSDRYPTTRHLSWSPDGRWWLVGDTLFSTGQPQTRRLAGALVYGRHQWSPDGACVAFSLDWEDLAVVPLSGAAPVRLGAGLGCGWDGEGVFYYLVWRDAALRFREEL